MLLVSERTSRLPACISTNYSNRPIHFAADGMSLSSFKFQMGSVRHFLCNCAFRPFKLIKIADFGMNQKRVCNFLL